MTLPSQTLHGQAAEWMLTEPLPGGPSEFAELWLAHPVHAPGSLFVVKLSRAGGGADGKTARRQTQREITRLATMRESDYIAKPIDTAADPDAEAVWFAMEYSSDGSVAQWFGPRGVARRKLSSLLKLARCVVQGLDDAQMVHRDLQPENLLLFGREQSTRPGVRITDWGRSVDHGVSWRSAHLRPTSAAFAAPQAFDSDQPVDVRDDLLSVGAILWWCVTGVAPGLSESDPITVGDNARSEARLAKLVQARAQLPRLDELYPGVPPRVAQLVASLLSAQREDRMPPRESRHDYVQWVLDQLSGCDEELAQIEAVRGAPVEVGPGVVTAPPPLPSGNGGRLQLEAGPPARSENGTSRQAARAHLTPTGTVERPRAPELRHSGATATPRTVPLAPQRTAAYYEVEPESLARRERTRGSRVEQDAAIFLGVALVLLNFLVFVMAFDHLGLTLAPAAILAAVVAGGVGVLDFLLLTRRPRRAAVLARAVLGVLLALVATWALANAVFKPELSTSGPSPEHARLTTNVAAVDRTHQDALDTRHKAEAAAKLRRHDIKVAIDQGCAEACAGLRAERSQIEQTLANLREAAAIESASYRGQRAVALDQLEGKAKTVTQERSLADYVTGQPAALLLVVVLFVLLLALESFVLLAARRVYTRRGRL